MASGVLNLALSVLRELGADGVVDVRVEVVRNVVGDGWVVEELLFLGEVADEKMPRTHSSSGLGSWVS